jgi:hypothetical protein
LEADRHWPAGHRHDHRHRARQSLARYRPPLAVRGADRVVIALREASGNDKVAWDTAAGQIVAMGESAKAKDAAIALQNERIDDLARRAVQARARADELRRIADRAEAQKASALRRLSSMAATPGTRDDCMTLIREADEALNLVREAEAK